jgi:hypothetical protein
VIVEIDDGMAIVGHRDRSGAELQLNNAIAARIC